MTAPGAYVGTRKQARDKNHPKTFASLDVEACLAENDAEGVAFEYPARVFGHSDLPTRLLRVLLLIALRRLATVGYTGLEVVLLLEPRALCATGGRVTWHARREFRVCQSLALLGNLSRGCADFCGMDNQAGQCRKESQQDLSVRWFFFSGLEQPS